MNKSHWFFLSLPFLPFLLPFFSCFLFLLTISHLCFPLKFSNQKKGKLLLIIKKEGETSMSLIQEITFTKLGFKVGRKDKPWCEIREGVWVLVYNLWSLCSALCTVDWRGCVWNWSNLSKRNCWNLGIIFL